VKFKLDENIPRAVARMLHLMGYDVHDVHVEGLAGSDDGTLITRASTEDRVFVTMDLDFSDVRAYRPSEYSGILIVRSRRHGKNDCMALMEKALPVISRHEMRGSLVIVEDDKLRIRRSD
jgi:predicted nuclease of predicted toxin-antitoxin system